jgi:hypothetical protein
VWFPGINFLTYRNLKRKNTTLTAILYYPDADIANRKWSELVGVVEQDGLHGLTQVIRDGNPGEQGFNGTGFKRALDRCFKEMTSDAK